MTTSFTVTRDQLKTMVLDKLGVTSTTVADADKVFEAINMRLKEMHRLGVFWRKVTNVPVTFSLSSGIATASAGAGEILFPIKMTYKNGSNDDPIDIIGMSQYAAIEDKTRKGNPDKALWKGGSEFIFYPVPSANGTAKLLYEKITDDAMVGGAAIDVEVSMMRWMKDLIAYDLCDTFKQPESKIVRLEREALRAELNIRKLAVQRTDYDPVAVDDFTSSGSTETDYGLRR